MRPDPEFWRGKRVLLTGHTGFKGAWLATWLGQMGAEVCGFALAPATTPSLFELLRLNDRVDSRIGDLRDPKSIDDVVASFRPEIVLHLAAQALVHESYVRPAETFATNTMGLIHLFEAVRRQTGVRVVVNVTSDKCYENREWEWAYRETEAMGGSDPYSASKGCAELITASWRRSFFSKTGQSLASARAGNVIGGGDWSPDRLVPDCLRAFGAGEPVLIRSPRATRPWQHVLEPVSGYLMLAERLWADGSEFADGWNFGPSDDDAIPVADVVGRLATLWGHNARWEIDAHAHNKEAMLLKVDASKARLHLKWRPKLSVNAALEWTVDWQKRLAAGESALAITTDQISKFYALGKF